jgi:hypothetical protein
MPGLNREYLDAAVTGSHGEGLRDEKMKRGIRPNGNIPDNQTGNTFFLTQKIKNTFFFIKTFLGDSTLKSKLALTENKTKKNEKRSMKFFTILEKFKKESRGKSRTKDNFQK